MTTKPMEELAELAQWLREEAPRQYPSMPTRLLRWADEVEIADRRIEVLYAERDSAHQRLDRAIKHLSGIWGLLSPEDVALGNGVVSRFVNPIANETLRALSAAIKAIPDEVEAATAATEQEPVAWRLKRESDAWIYFEDHPTWHYENGFEVEPLYAHPPAQDRDALAALKELVECKAEAAKAMGGLGVDVVRLGLANLRLDAAWDRARAVVARNGAGNEVSKSDESDVALLKEFAEALKDAAQFIRNGVEYGYIRMPDPDTPDTALQTPSVIDAALSRLRARLEQK